jgi:hypothetical protein
LQHSCNTLAEQATTSPESRSRQPPRILEGEEGEEEEEEMNTGNVEPNEREEEEEQEEPSTQNPVPHCCYTVVTLLSRSCCSVVRLL